MKYIILDIDGVVSTLYESMEISTQEYWKDNQWAKEIKVCYPFNKECVEILNEIITLTDAEIILSSDWKRHKTLKELDIIFKHNGVVKSPIDVTPNYRDNYSNFEACRVHEITHYIAENQLYLDDIIIIDDLDIEILFPTNLRKRFIKTNNGLGLKEHDIKDLILNKFNIC